VKERKTKESSSSKRQFYLWAAVTRADDAPPLPASARSPPASSSLIAVLLEDKRRREREREGRKGSDRPPACVPFFSRLYTATEGGSAASNWARWVGGQAGSRLLKAAAAGVMEDDGEPS
jgi:hypothetical protein